MAKKSPSNLIALVPSSQIVDREGEEILVAGNTGDNLFLSKLMFAEMRHSFHKQLAKYREDEAQFTPKELKDMAEAARIIAQGSGEVYKDADAKDGTNRQSEPEPASPIDFGALTKVTEVETTQHEPSAESVKSQP